MDSYGYAYGGPYPRMPPNTLADHGDGYGQYNGLGPLTQDLGPSYSQQRAHKARPRSRTASESRSQSRDRSRDISSDRSRSKSSSRSRSRSGSRPKDLHLKEPGFLDAFRVLYLTPSKHKKNSPKYLATQRRRDRVQEFLKADGLGSKHWFFYPRRSMHSEGGLARKVASRETSDQRVKIDGDFFRRYRRSNKVDNDAPIAKLKRWELVLYKKLGFVQAI